MMVNSLFYFSNPAVTVVPRRELAARRKNKVPFVAVLAYPHKWEYDLKRLNITGWPHPSNSRVYKQNSRNATWDR